MQVTCPCCHARFPLDAALADDSARAALEEMGQLGGDVARLAIGYLGCFRPAGRALAWSRAVKLLRELSEAMHEHYLRRSGRLWRVTREQWVEALGIVVERHHQGQITLPLKDHGYLFEVARRLVDRAEAEAERAAEAEVRNRLRSGDGPAPVGEIAERVVDGPGREAARRALDELRRGRGARR